MEDDLQIMEDDLESMEDDQKFLECQIKNLLGPALYRSCTCFGFSQYRQFFFVQSAIPYMYINL
jgi:hypothetical protein